MGTSFFPRRVKQQAHPETENPNERGWNFVAISWGIMVIVILAILWSTMGSVK